MKKVNLKNLVVSASFLAAFFLWTVAVKIVNVQAIGPLNTKVGFATLNAFFHNLTGVHMWLYVLTDWLSLIPVAFVLGFALVGLIQWIKRKRLGYVDQNIIALGGFYILVFLAYFWFEKYVVNYRPVLINSFLEASYPSSTTMLVMCVMPTAVLQLNNRMKKSVFKGCILAALVLYSALMVIARLISGVHWLTDIIGGIFVSAGLVSLYKSVANFE
ncbi:MAG: phosphatase PAP2 family protein [Oscillospiraceae bacterium]|nr:phosphatase PAP2 family protein [Oscillospiraceae bacterium]